VKVLSIVGQARSGKSFLLNQLTQSIEFTVEAGLKPCTSGVVVSVKDDLVVLDTEGLGSERDASLFTIAMVLSSLLIYNSKGVIDELALNRLSFVSSLAQVLDPEASPALIWVLRDFALDLRSSRGTEITPDDYLEAAMAETRAVGTVLREYFPMRHCFTLVRPCLEESDLKSISQETLRPEFIRGIESLKGLIQDMAKVKRVNGDTVTGPILVDLASSFIEAINKKALPQLKSTWQSIVDSRNKSAAKTALLCAEVGLKEFVRKFIPLESEDLTSRLKLVKETAIKTFREEAMGDERMEREAEMLQTLKNSFKKIKVDNFDQSKCLCIDLFSKLCRDFVDIEFNNDDEFQQAWMEVKLEYDARARGPAKMEVWNTQVTGRLLEASSAFSKHRTKMVTEDMAKVGSCQSCDLW